MFQRRKKPDHKTEQPVLTLWDSQMQQLYCGPLSEFVFPEGVVLACSKEFFNDPAPCEIHRRAVQLRLYGEMMEMLPSGQTVAVEKTPPCISQYCQQFHPAYIRIDQFTAR